MRTLSPEQVRLNKMISAAAIKLRRLELAREDTYNAWWKDRTNREKYEIHFDICDKVDKCKEYLNIWCDTYLEAGYDDYECESEIASCNTGSTGEV